MIPTYTIQKDFGEFPAAHRQPFHSGHCAMIHGHNWRFVAYLKTTALDENGFVFDFGQFAEIREWLRQNFDHTLLLQNNDPELVHLMNTLRGLARVICVDSVSCEGLAKMFFERLRVFIHTMGLSERVLVERVVIFEDVKNSATYAASY